MSSLANRLLDAVDLSAGKQQDKRDVMDVGAYTQLQIQARCVRVGSGGNLKLEHAAINEEGAFIQLGANISLTALSNARITHTNFLRYLRWSTDGAVAGSPAAIVDVIAKDG